MPNNSMQEHIDISAAILACPICKEVINTSNKVMRCANNHCFDQAKQGYWNLLAVQQKKSKDPGDNPLMVSARKQFLDLDHYLPLAKKIQQKITAIQDKKETDTKDTLNILDMGCGEGYYTSYWQQEISKYYSSRAQTNTALNFIGLDISKHAIKAATQRNKDITWLVASGARMPIMDNSLDTLIVLFSRLMPQPFANVLKDKAALILVWPTDQHLIELKHAMYDEIKTSSYNPQEELATLFDITAHEVLSFSFWLDNEQDLTTLLEMTPHGQRINEEKKHSLFSRLPVELTFDVNIGHFTKKAAAENKEPTLHL